jgi:hypothetical protein
MIWSSRTVLPVCPSLALKNQLTPSDPAIA